MIRPAAGADLAALVALERALFGADAWTEASLVAELLDLPGGVLLVAEEEGEDRRELVGYAVARVAGDVADLRRVGVRADRQRRGQGRRLVAAAADWAAAAGAVRMLLEVSETNAPATRLYAALGFLPIARRRRYYRDATDAVVMERALPAAPGRVPPGAPRRVDEHTTRS